jgi:Mlc titration factor MtfA (ptsG expression regulator)
MAYYLVLMEFILLLVVLFLLWKGWGRYREMRLKREIAATPFPGAWREWLERTPHYPLLTESMRRELERDLRYFVAVKEFRGVGIDVTAEMQVGIAFYACLMVRGIPDECFDPLETLLIYPEPVWAEQVREEGGIVSREEEILDGQSSGDTLVFAWSEVEYEIYHHTPRNVVIHELAHVLDFEEGWVDGVPELPPGEAKEWAEVNRRHFLRLRERAEEAREPADLGPYEWIGEYAATSEVEFFAVLSERYFQTPRRLRRVFPDLYGVYREFYGLDAAELFEGIEE